MWYENIRNTQEMLFCFRFSLKSPVSSRQNHLYKLVKDLEGKFWKYFRVKVGHKASRTCWQQYTCYPWGAGQVHGKNIKSHLSVSNHLLHSW